MTQFETTVLKSKPISAKMLAEGKVGARLVEYPNGLRAIMKIASPETMKNDRQLQRGLPTWKLPFGEVAFYKLSKLLGFDIVPETVLGRFEKTPASFQEYVTAAKIYDVEPRLRKPRKKEDWSVAFRETMRDVVPQLDTLKLTLLDFLAASRDRHGANYGVRLEIHQNKARWRLIGWDNGCAFGLTQENYHCVAHKYLFRYAFDLSPVWDNLKRLKRSQLVASLSGLISDAAIDHVWMRVQFVTLFPHRMPWVNCSLGHDDVDEFPSYADFFAPIARQPLYIANQSWFTALPNT